jgi:hypothetical protein
MSEGINILLSVQDAGLDLMALMTLNLDSTMAGTVCRHLCIGAEIIAGVVLGKRKGEEANVVCGEGVIRPW